MREYDNSYHDKRDEMAIKMAKEGDTRAISTLQRIIARNEDPDKRSEAEELLAALQEPADA
ncbi:MAG: hypothetical protein OXG26_01455 [Caldilineaceae bacterium]|nr:hypothetical protein [Caldilineaceae bacterium]